MWRARLALLFVQMEATLMGFKEQIRELQEKLSRAESAIESLKDRVMTLEKDSAHREQLSNLERRLADAFDVVAQKLDVPSWTIFERGRR